MKISPIGGPVPGRDFAEVIGLKYFSCNDQEIKKILGGLKGENGDEVIDKIFEKEEIYHGPYTPMAPDLVCLPKDGYDLKGTLEKKKSLAKISLQEFIPGMTLSVSFQKILAFLKNHRSKI